MASRSEKSVAMEFNCLIKKEDGLYVAHCLELDIVATGNTIKAVRKDIGDLIIAAVDYAFSNDNLDALYHPAPKEVWQEFYKCTGQVEEKRRLKSVFKKDKELETFVPPWIVAKTCILESHCSV